MFTGAYVFVSFIGLWANYWFYRGFQLPILEYMQATDYLVAGLRDPMYGLILVVTVLLVSLISWPDAWRRNHPERVLALRRRWWGRALFPSNRMMRWTGVGMSPETGITLMAFAFTVWGASIYVQNKAADIRDHDGGQPVQVTLAGKATAQPGHARLLGTSSGFVFLGGPASVAPRRCRLRGWAIADRRYGSAARSRSDGDAASTACAGCRQGSTESLNNGCATRRWPLSKRSIVGAFYWARRFCQQEQLLNRMPA